MTRQGKGPMFNASGYYDPTAYEAIKNVDKERGGSLMTPQANRGEIWEVESNDGSRTYEMVVVQTFSNYAVGLMLRDAVAAENDVAIRGRGIMHCDAGRLVYAYNDKFVTFIRAMTDQEFIALKDKVCTVLNLSWNSGYVNWDGHDETPQTPAIDSERVKKLTAEREALATERAELKSQLEEVLAELEKERGLHSARIDGPELAAVRDDLIGTRAERDTYKRLYEDALNRLLKKES